MYTPIDMIEMLDMIHEGNRTVGGLTMTAKGYGIVGFVRFLDCYYLNFITQRRLVSLVCFGEELQGHRLLLVVSQVLLLPTAVLKALYACLHLE